MMNPDNHQVGEEIFLLLLQHSDVDFSSPTWSQVSEFSSAKLAHGSSNTVELRYPAMVSDGGRTMF
jgi:hypothetical protein